MTEDDNPTGSIKNALLERVRDPFLFALAVALASWNWRFVYILLHGGPSAAQTIASAHSQIRDWPLLVPVIAAIAFVVVHPWIRGAVALVRAYADIAAENWRRKAAERRALMSAGEWRQHPIFLELERRLSQRDEALKLTLERLHASWMARRPIVSGTMTIEKLARREEFTGFAVLTEYGLLKADERTVRPGTPAQNVGYVVDNLPACLRAIVAGPSAPVPMPATTAEVDGIALLVDGIEETFKGAKPPPNALAWVRYLKDSWGVFEHQRPN